jgi:serpin B
MDRRHFLALLSAPAVAALLQACGSDDTSSPGTNSTPTSAPPSTTPGTSGTPTTGEARSQLARVAATPRDATAAALASNAFGADVYRALTAEDPSANLVFSPASIALALTMTAAGARGDTQRQMVEALRIDDADAMHRAANALTSELEARSGDPDVNVDLSIASSLWGQIGLPFEQAFLDLLAAEYGAGMNLVDYRSDPEAARVAINEWVADETRDRITELLAPGIVTADARLTLVNAIYMKAKWARQFEQDATSDLAFTNASGATVTVPAMRMSRFIPYSVGDGWKAVELPYEGEEVAMLLIVPDAGELAATEEGLSVAAVADALEPRSVHLALPRFDIESSLSVGETLKALGMELAFSDAADFSGMTTADELAIGAVIHQANITVDELGTEAAAATAVIIETTAAPDDEPVELTIDRPFLFAIRDRATGAVLFLGRVADPSA